MSDKMQNGWQFEFETQTSDHFSVLFVPGTHQGRTMKICDSLTRLNVAPETNTSFHKCAKDGFLIITLTTLKLYIHHTYHEQRITHYVPNSMCHKLYIDQLSFNFNDGTQNNKSKFNIDKTEKKKLFI